jgi:3-hydroxyacyl-CoA dehydrogenase
MSNSDIPRVAVIGTGDTGQGWAALALSYGWPVAIFDSSATALSAAEQHIAERVEVLIQNGRAVEATVRSALSAMRVGRSLLQAVTDADWIIESVPEDLHVKQRVLEQIEQVCRLHAITTSSSGSIHASALIGRLRRPERLMVALPLNPVEFIPAVEIVPGPRTDPACVEQVRFWLHSLGRVPVVLAREIPGNLLGRISAAVWRECIQLVLDGTLEVGDIDAAVAFGPSLAWAAAGPHLSSQLSGIPGGAALKIGALLATYESWWGGLSTWKQLGPEEQHRLIRAVDRAYGGQGAELRKTRDARLAQLLRAIDESNPPPGAEAESAGMVLPPPEP